MSYTSEVVGNIISKEYQNVGKTGKNESSSKVSKSTYGSTIGTPKLSEKAAEYYAELKKKYSDMDFILVSNDKKNEAQANAGRYANPNRTVVLISEEKVERMATDEDYRKQYETIIANSSSQLAQLKESLGSTASSVKGFGIQVNDGGTASFFAVVDKSLAAQKKRIEKQAEKKAEAKKEAKEAAEEKRAEKRAENAKKAKAEKAEYLEDTVMVTASSMEELVKKIQDILYASMSDQVQTKEEAMIGQHIDFRG